MALAAMETLTASTAAQMMNTLQFAGCFYL